MKVLHVSHYSSKGGAAIAASRLHGGLLKQGIDSYFWSTESPLDGSLPYQASKWSLYLRFRFAQLLLIVFFRGYKLRALNIFPNRGLRDAVRSSDYDIIHLHWISGDLLSVVDIIGFQKPVVITLHDQWYISGVKHLTETEYFDSEYPNNSWLENWLRNYKLRKLNNIGAGLIAPSEWMRRGVEVSSNKTYHHYRHIFNLIDLNIFRSKGEERDIKTLLFGSFGGNSVEHKGFEFIVQMLRENLDYFRKKNICIKSFGNSNKVLDSLDLEISYLGDVQDENDMADIYNSATCLVLPSLIDNLPSMAIESVACGTPVVAFNVGGVSNIIQDGVNGVLVPKRDVVQLFAGVKGILEGDYSFDLDEMRSTVEKFNYEVVVNKHCKFYSEIVAKYAQN